MSSGEFQDPDLEKLYAFDRLLIMKLGEGDDVERVFGSC
jgi:hypothetical protein